MQPQGQAPTCCVEGFSLRVHQTWLAIENPPFIDIIKGRITHANLLFSWRFSIATFDYQRRSSLTAVSLKL
jgi:hypothetical protein